MEGALQSGKMAAAALLKAAIAIGGHAARPVAEQAVARFEARKGRSERRLRRASDAGSGATGDQTGLISSSTFLLNNVPNEGRSEMKKAVCSALLHSSHSTAPVGGGQYAGAAICSGPLWRRSITGVASMVASMPAARGVRRVWQYNVVPPVSIYAAGQRRLRRFSGRIQFSDPFVRAWHRRRLRVRQHQRGPASTPIRRSSVTPSRAISPTSRAASALPGTGCCFMPRAARPGHSTGIKSLSYRQHHRQEPRRAPDGSAAWASNMPTIRAGR